MDSLTEELSEDETDNDAMLDYIERFYELLDSKQYNMAAVHAANSPRGILRTTETLHRLAGNMSHNYSPSSVPLQLVVK